MTTALARGIPVTLLSAVTTGTSPAVAVPSTYKEVNVTIKGAGTISAGTVIIEEADDPTFAGLWSQIQLITLPALSGGGEQVVHASGECIFIRARLSVDVTGAGGNVTVTIQGT